MKSEKLKRALLVVPILLIIAFFYTVSMQKKMKQIKREVNWEMTAKGIQLQVALTVGDGEIRWFLPGEPKSVSREIYFKEGARSPNAFYLSPITSKTVEFEGQFVGDVKRSGSCNVDTLRYVPHAITHLETSAHILSPDVGPPTVKDIPLENLSGVVYLMDLSHLGTTEGESVPWDVVREKLEKIALPVSMLALKTRASLLPRDYDFSGKDFLSLAPETAKGIHDYRFPLDSKKTVFNRIDCLIVDLPSIDPESDGGKLSAHRNFFGLPLSGVDVEDGEKRALVELAWFGGLEEGYYYAVMTPPRFETHAVTTDIVFRPLIEME